MHYWRDGGAEVDFVLHQGPHLIGIEVKSGHSRRLEGMAKFRDTFKKARTMVAGPDGVPIDEFLSVPADYWFDAL